MAIRYGLKFTYHNGTDQDEFYSTHRKRDRVFKAWSDKLNDKGYRDLKVKSVTKIEKS